MVSLSPFCLLFPYTHHNHSPAITLLTSPPLAVLCTALGAIQLGSKTAFTDLVGSFIILSTASYACAILPHVLTGRSHVPKGPFWMGRAGYLVNIVAVVLIIFFNIMFCFRAYLFPPLPFHFYSRDGLPRFAILLHANAFPHAAYVYPTTVSTMNYNSVILVGVLFLTTAWWFIHGARKYSGPKLIHLYDGGRVVDANEMIEKHEHSG